MRHKKCLTARLAAAVLSAMIAFTSMDISVLTADAMMSGDSLTAQTADIMPLGADGEDNGDTDTDVAFDKRFEQGGEKAWSNEPEKFKKVPLNQEFGNSPRTQRYLYMTYPDTYYRAIATGDKGLGIADDTKNPVMVVNEGDKQGDRTLTAGEYARKKDPYLRLLSGEDNKVKKEFNEEYGYFYLPDYSNKDDGNFGASDTQCIFYIDGDTDKIKPSKDEKGRANTKSLKELNGGTDNGPLYGFERAQGSLVFYTANAAVWKALWANNCQPCVILRDAAFDYKSDRSVDLILRITDAECSDRSREAKSYKRPDGTDVKGRCFMKIMGGPVGSEGFNRLRVGAGNCAWVKSSIEFYNGELSGDIPKKENGEACKSLEEILQVQGLEADRDSIKKAWETYIKPNPVRLTGLMTYKDCDIGELFSPQEGFDPVIYGTYGALSGAENMIVTNGKSSIRANGGSATSYYAGEPKSAKSYRVLFSRSGVGGTANGYEENSCNKFTMSFTDQTSVSYVSGFMAKGNADIDEDGFAIITNNAGGWFSSSGPAKVAFKGPVEQVSSLKSLLDYRKADDPNLPEREPFYTAAGPKDFDRLELSEEEKQALIEQSGNENLDFEPPLDPVPGYSYTGQQSMFIYKITQYIPYLNVNDKDVARLASLTLENELPKYVDVVSCYMYTTAKPEDKQKAAIDAAMGNAQEPGYFSWNPSTTADGRKKVTFGVEGRTLKTAQDFYGRDYVFFIVCKMSDEYIANVDCGQDTCEADMKLIKNFSTLKVTYENDPETLQPKYEPEEFTSNDCYINFECLNGDPSEERATLQIVKWDKDPEHSDKTNATVDLSDPEIKKLSGAEFELWVYEPNTGVYLPYAKGEGSDSYITDDNGVVRFSNILISDTDTGYDNGGRFRIVEKHPPNGYKYDEAEGTLVGDEAHYDVWLDPAEYKLNEETGKMEQVFDGINVQPIANIKTELIFELYKRDSVTGELLTGAEFDVYEFNGTDYDFREHLTEQVAGSGVYNTSDYEITPTNMGMFCFIETKAPAGYRLLEDPVYANLNNLDDLEHKDKVVVYIYNDLDGTGRVKLVKTDSTNKSILVAGAEYELVANGDIAHVLDATRTVYRKGDVVDTGITDEDGEIDFGGQMPGKYLIRETKAADGYKLDTGVHEFEVTRNTNMTVEVSDVPDGVPPIPPDDTELSVAIKADRTTGVTLNGATGRYTGLKSAGAYYRNELINYTVTVTNCTGTDVADIKVSSLADTALLSEVKNGRVAFLVPDTKLTTAGKTAALSTNDNGLSVAIDKLGAYDSVTLMMSGTLNERISDKQDLTETVKVSGKYLKDGVMTQTRDTAYTTDSDSVNLRSGPIPDTAGLRVAKIASNTKGVVLQDGHYAGSRQRVSYSDGDRVDYKITVSNVGPCEIKDIYVTDCLSDELKACLNMSDYGTLTGLTTNNGKGVSVTVSQQKYEGAVSGGAYADRYTVKIDKLSAGDSVDIPFSLTLKSGLGEQRLLANYVYALGTYVENGIEKDAASEDREFIDINSDGPVPPEPTPEEDPEIIAGKTANKASVNIGDDITYTVDKVKNGKDIPLKNFELHDELPAGAHLTSVSTGVYSEAHNYTLYYTTNKDGDASIWEDDLNTKTSTTLKVADLDLDSDEYITSLIFSYGTVGAGFTATQSPSYTLKVVGGGSAVLKNKIWATGYTGDQLRSSKVVDVYVPLNTGDSYLVVSKIADKTAGVTYAGGKFYGIRKAGTYKKGDTVTYTIRVYNASDVVINNIVVTDALSAQLAERKNFGSGFEIPASKSITTTNGASTTIAASDSTYSGSFGFDKKANYTDREAVVIGSLSPGDSVKVTYKLRLKSASGTITGASNVAAATGTYNNTNTNVTTEVGYASMDEERINIVGEDNIGVDKKPMSDTVYLSSTLEYEITEVRNNTDSMLTNFTVTDTLPKGTALSELNTGVYSDDVQLSVYYKTNKSSDLKLWKKNLSSKKGVTLYTKNLKLKKGEYVKEFSISYGTVPAKFRETVSPKYKVVIGNNAGKTLKNVLKGTGYANGYKLAQTTTVKTDVTDDPAKVVKLTDDEQVTVEVLDNNTGGLGKWLRGGGPKTGDNSALPIALFAILVAILVMTGVVIAAKHSASNSKEETQGTTEEK